MTDGRYETKANTAILIVINPEFDFPETSFIYFQKKSFLFHTSILNKKIKMSAGGEDIAAFAGAKHRCVMFIDQYLLKSLHFFLAAVI